MGERMRTKSWSPRLSLRSCPKPSAYSGRLLPGAWVSMTRGALRRRDDDGEPAAGGATVTAQVHSCLDRLAAIERPYVGGLRVQLLDGAHDHDDEVYRAWCQCTEMRLRNATIRLRHLAVAAATGSLPAPRVSPCRLKGDLALQAMALHVQELGDDVVAEAPIRAGQEGDA